MHWPQVTVNQGTLNGVEIKTEKGFSYLAFFGVPYAKPPVGNLRFKDPQPPEEWVGERDATTEGKICSHVDIFFKKGYQGGEDCLYLNVYIPKGTVLASELPVMFWIHGGGFMAGSGSKQVYGPDFLVEKNVIIVTINYRLGPLGFLCLHAADVPGNAGLKDQLMALKWVKDNIRQFGGNPENVTIFGESAGGASVVYLMMSPLAKGLFAKVINQSGTSINEWATQSDPVAVAFKLGELLEFKTESKEDLLKFLMGVPVETLIKASLNPSLNNENEIAFSPVVEHIFPETAAFITQLPRDILQSGNFSKVPTITGFNSNEGALFALKLEGLDVATVTREQLVPDFGIYIPRELKQTLNSETKKKVMEKIKEHYFSDDTKTIQNFFAMMSDYAFVKDIDYFAKSLSRFIPESYYYKFNFSGSRNVLRVLFKFPYHGAGHADDLGYIFEMTPTEEIKFETTERDLTMIKQMVEMWTNFAKTGNPTPGLSDNISTIWKPIQDNKINCYNMDENCSLIQNPCDENMQFWKSLHNIV